MTGDTMAKKAAKTMSDDHKAALADGRAQGRAVRNYLEALDQSRPKRGRGRSSDSIGRRLEDIEAELAGAAPMDRLRLLQERRDLQSELERQTPEVDLDALEEAFVQVAEAYSERKGISYATWREAGVSAAALKAAGVTRGRR